MTNGVRNYVTDLVGRRANRRYRERDDRSRRLWAQSLVALTNVAALVYIVWYIGVYNRDAAVVPVAVLIAEILALVSFDLYALVTWQRRFHDPARITPRRSRSVDVLITTAGEALDVLEPTVRAATEINYPDFRVVVLDDGGRADVRALAERYGVAYLARLDRTDAKAGNLNYGLAHTHGELVLTLDADQVCHPEILSETVGFADLDRVAFLQTRQHFRVPEGDPYSNRDNIFYEVMQRGKDHHNAAFSCGSGVIYRRDALEDVGGFSTWNLVEDLHTSMRLHDRGWRSLYYDHALTTGSMPIDTRGTFRQRGQWAFDSLRLFFWDSPLRRRGLRAVQRAQYFQIGYTYLVSAFVMPVFLIVPPWSLFTGTFLVHCPLWHYVLVRGIYFVLQTAAFLLLNRPSDPTAKAYRQWVGLFPVFAAAAFRALRARWSKPAYAVNRKPNEREAGSRDVVRVLPHIGLCVVIVIAVIYSAVYRTLPWPVFWVDVAWGAWAIWSVSGIIRASLSRKRLGDAA